MTRTAFGNLSGNAAAHKAQASVAVNDAQRYFGSAWEYLDADNCSAAYKDMVHGTFALGEAYAEARMGTKSIQDEELRRVLDVLGPTHMDLERAFKQACVAKGRGYKMPRSAYLNGLRRRR